MSDRTYLAFFFVYTVSSNELLIHNKNINDMAKQGNIGVTSENIFPIIKKFLYSDHEIFLRELVSNAVDATQKLKTLHPSVNSKANWAI